MLLMGVVLGILHYKLKPAFDENAVGAYAQSMTNSIEWQGQIAPYFGLRGAVYAARKCRS